MAQSAVRDDVFRALSDPTRRNILESLSRGPATVTELAVPFAMKLPSFVQHLSVLEKSRLVKSSKQGRVRTYQIVPERLDVVEDWLAEQRRYWEARLDRLDVFLKLNQKEKGA